jgi:hypothetical protein
MGEIRDFLVWVQETLGDDEVRKTLLEDVGLEPTNPPPKPNLPQDKLDSIGRYQQTADADRAAFESTLSDLKAVFDSVRSFIASFQLSPALVGEVTSRFLNLLALNYLRLRQPHVFVVANLLSFVEDTVSPHASGKVAWSRIGSLFQDGFFYVLDRVWGQVDTEEKAQNRSDFYFAALAATAAFMFKEHARTLYGWDAAPESTSTVGDRISKRMLSTVVFTGKIDPGTGESEQIKASFLFLTPQQGGQGLYLALGGGGQIEEELSEDWKMTVKLSSGAAVDMTFGGDKKFTITGPLGGPPDIPRQRRPAIDPDETNRSFVLPSDSDTHIDIGNIALTAAVNANAIDIGALDAEIKLSINDCAVVIATKDNDGFLSSLLPAEGLRLPFNFGIGASRKRGLFTEGNVPFLSGRSTRAARLTRDVAPATPPNGAPVPLAGAIGKGFSATIPIGIGIGPVEFNSLQLKLAANETTPDTSDVAAEASVALTLRLGPAFISIDRLGFEAKMAFAEKTVGNIGFADFSIGPALPRGVGVSVDGSGVTGGGFLFLDQQRGLYAGAVQLNLEGGIAVRALGIIATKLPDGRKGFSLLVIITAEDFEPYLLGLNFWLTGIGGLLAINRTFDEQVLRDGVKNRTLDAVLFPRTRRATRCNCSAISTAPSPSRQGITCLVQWSRSSGDARRRSSRCSSRSCSRSASACGCS